MHDYAVIDYAATLEGSPLLEVEPKAPKMLAGGTDFWIKLDENTLLKGFSDQLVGMQTTETAGVRSCRFRMTTRVAELAKRDVRLYGHSERPQEHASSGTQRRIGLPGRRRINPG